MRIVIIAGAAVSLLAMVPATVAAHTDTDLVGVPSATESTITLKPTHGCGESPTVAVRIRAPSADARAEEVDGWTATSTPDGAGNTVVEWTGGMLPTDEDGAFPVVFTAPDAPGLLLTFPAIQVCESGEELAWISGDPQDEFPAPRVLVLPPGSEPAETIDDVPLDAPGRDQLVAIVDVDNPNVAPTTAPAVAAVPTTIATPATAAPATAALATAAAAPVATTAAAPAVSAPAVGAVPTTAAATSATIAADSEDTGGSAGPVVVMVALGVSAAIGGVVVALRRRRPVPEASAGVGAGDDLEQVGPRSGDA